MIGRFFFGFCFLSLLLTEVSGQVYKTSKAKISFISEAPLETIKASNAHVLGVLDVKSQQFSFKANMKFFEGFNNPLQKEHFFENYMESDVFPEAAFSGKIIEPLGNLGKLKVRAKGMLTVHGVSNEVLIDVNIEVSKTGLTFSSEFTVLLDDYNIHVPRIVSQKIAKEIKVKCRGSLEL